eukprot:TRINITY_DN3706_c0_g1_i1.p1 TRINITY_DN3706_c0_g1~~TRINITY_DN3706_c0_g1_i1.p1  ORF type:complete len:419 (+),score=81.65 TRINITY_DN3706_c0_g1_i1:34-1290(+)
MSNLQRKVLGGAGGGVGGGMAPPPPRLSAPGVLPPQAPPAPGRRRPGSFRRRSYSPVSWKKYWDSKEQLKSDDGVFTVYSKGSGDTLVLLLHGGGYSGLTWSLVAEELYRMAECRIAAIDLRGHGESVGGSEDMSLDALSKDVRCVADQLIQSMGLKSLVLVGHSLGGAVAVSVAKEGGIAGLVVIDVVEGTALESLNHMQGFLRSRPQQFRSVSHAIEWCVRSGQARNIESAKVSMPGQIKDAEGRLVSSNLDDLAAQPKDQIIESATRLTPEPPPDSIKEEDEESSNNGSGEKARETSSADSNDAPAGNGPYTWAIDLSTTEPYWSGWFADLTANFLSAPSAKLLMLAGVDRLDKDMMVGQMQGKFQMLVLPQVGHAIQEDSPDKVAEAIANFVVRNRFAPSKDSNIHVPKIPLRP